MIAIEAPVSIVTSSLQNNPIIMRYPRDSISPFTTGVIGFEVLGNDVLMLAEVAACGPVL